MAQQDLRAKLPPLRPRVLAPQLTAPTVMIAGNGLKPVTVNRGSRAAVSFNGQIVAAGGYPAPLFRKPMFAVLPPPGERVNVVVGVTAAPNNAKRKRRR